ncbi:hypothetical protein Tco_1307845 [Tanacetum coccineum]
MLRGNIVKVEGMEIDDESTDKKRKAKKVAYNSDALYGISHWGPKCKFFYRARQAIQSSHHVYSRMKILSIVRITVDKQFGYGYLKKIVVPIKRSTHSKRQTFRDCASVRFPCLDDKEPYTIFYEPRGVVYLYKDDKKYLMRKDKVHKFGDATIKKVCDKLDYMLHNFVLDYNGSMPKRKWIEKDQQRTTSMLKALEIHC